VCALYLPITMTHKISHGGRGNRLLMKALKNKQLEWEQQNSRIKDGG